MGRFATFACVSVLALWLAQSDSAVRGTVTDPQGAVIAHAHVRILDAQSRATLQSTTTDATGRFQLSGLSAGNLLLSVSATGFRTSLQSLGTLAPGATNTRDIHLLPLDCTAPGVNCDIFTTRPYTDPHPILFTRDLTLDAPGAIDLETGTPLPLPDANADIQFVTRQNGLYLAPINRAVFATSLREGSCRALKPAIDSVRIDGFDRNSEIIVLTRNHSCARLYITSAVDPGSRHVALHLATRRR